MKIQDLRVEAERLVEVGEMPSLQQVLQTVVEVREEFRNKILTAQEPNQAGIEVLRRSS